MGPGMQDPHAHDEAQVLIVEDHATVAALVRMLQVGRRSPYA